MHNNELNYRNVLVMDLGHLGDIILSLPVLLSLRKALDKAKITVLVPSSAAELFKLFPLCDELITVDRTQLKKDPKHRSIPDLFRLVGDVRRRHFDLVIDLHSLYETNILGFLSGAPKRLFANRENRSLDFLANFRPSPAKQDKSLHLSSYYLNVLEPLGIEAGDPFSFELPVHFNGHKTDSPYLDGSPDRKRIGLFVGAGHESRCWKLENFAAVAKQLEEGINARTFVFLGPAEKHLESDVKRIFSGDTTIVSGLTVPQLAANLSEMSVLVSNDTGPMHLGAVVGTPIVLIMDDRAPRTYLPLTKNLELVGGESIDLISVDAVLAATHRLCDAGGK